MASLVVLVSLVAMATAGVVVPNRGYAGYPGYGRDDYRYGYSDYNKPVVGVPVKGDYAYAPVARKGVVYDAPYNSYGYDYNKPAAVYPANYDYNYNRPAVPVKKVVDPYPYYNDYQNVDYPYQGKFADAFPAKSIIPVRKDPFTSKSLFPATKRVAVDPYPYQPSFGVKKVVQPVAPVKQVVDPFAYQPDFVVRKTVNPFPAKAAFPVRQVVDTFPVRKVAGPYAYPAGKVVDPFFAPTKKVVDAYPYPSKQVVGAYPYPSKQVVGAYPYASKQVVGAYPYASKQVVGAYPYPSKQVVDPYYRKPVVPVKKVVDPYPYYRDTKAVAVPVKSVVGKAVVNNVVPAKKSSFGDFPGFLDLGKGFGGKAFSAFPKFKF